MVDSLRQPKVHPQILAAAKLMKCDACQARLTGGKWETCRTGAVLEMENLQLETSHSRDSRKRDSSVGYGVTCHRGSNLEDISSCREPGKRLIRRSKNDASRGVGSSIVGVR